MATPEPLLTPEQLSDYIGVPIGTLYVWRTRRQGPPGMKVGRHLRYRQSDVDAWLKQQTTSAA